MSQACGPMNLDFAVELDDILCRFRSALVRVFRD